MGKKKIYRISTSGDTMVTEDGFAYSTTICLEKQDYIISWDLDEPFDLSKANFENIVTAEDLYKAIEVMCALTKYPDGFFEDTLRIDDMSEVVSLTVKVDMDYYDEPEDQEIITDFFNTGIVGYDFINKKHIGKAVNMNEMIDELTEYAENSGFKDYYNRKIKDKTEEEIKKLYHDVFGK